MPTELIDASTGEIIPVAQSPVEVMEASREMSRVLMDVVEAQKLYSDIQGKKYLRLEAWQFLAGLAHITPRTREISEIHEDGRAVGVRVYVELIRDHDCAIIGGAYGRCDYSERIARSGKFACESMAQTRATSKAISQKLRFVPVLAGYAGTPAEEMTGVSSGPKQRSPRPPKWEQKSDEEIAQPDDPSWDTPAGNPEVRGGGLTDKTRVENGGVRPQPAEGDPGWLLEPLPKIASRPNWGGKTWAWVSEGKPGGDRHAWVNGVIDNPQASKALRLRCEFCAMRIEGKA